jgi:membrane protein YqaA with SNARE-associated domain
MIFDIFGVLASYGYIGIFLISLIGSSTIIFPIPSAAFVFATGAILNPFLIGLVSGIGSAIGESTGYALGLGGRKVIKRKWKKTFEKTEKLFQKYGGFFVILLFAGTPLPDDITGVVAGILRYPLKKFFVACLIGKVILHMILAYAGLYSMKWVLDVLASGF